MISKQKTEDEALEWFTSEIIIHSEKGPWTAEQRAAALSAIRVCLQSLGSKAPSESEVTEAFEKAVAFAKTYRPTCNGAAMPFEYRPGWDDDISPEKFEEVVAKMRSECEAVGLTVRTDHYR